MIEALVSFVIDKLGNCALGTAWRFRAVRDDIAWLEGELSMMQAFLKDVDRRSATDEGVMECLNQLQNVAFRIEDFLDLYAYKQHLMLNTKGVPPDIQYSVCLSFLGTIRGTFNNFFSTGPTNFNWMNEMSSEIASIKTEVEQIGKRMQTYGLHSITTAVLRGEGAEGGSTSTSTRSTVMVVQQQEIRPHHDHHSSSYSILEDQVLVEMVGFDEDVKVVEKWLLSDSEELSVMCIVGMGGSGKTTLARRDYTILAHRRFDRHLWVTAPDCTQLEGLIRTELREQAYKRIHNGQRKSSYVIVLDDISDISSCIDVIQRLQGSCRVLPPNCRGWVILISRNNMICSLTRYHEKNFHIHIIKPLSHDLAWDLFCRKAFPFRGVCPDYLNHVGKEIVKKCSGLPLAIVLMGRLLSCNKYSSPREWKGVLDHFDQELNFNPKLVGVKRIFQTSYNLLPSHVQYCFLYSCLFPKGSEIRRKKMIRLLVAQGFVKGRGRKTGEEVANDCIIQLIERNMLEPITCNFTGELVSYRVHDIMHELGVSNFKEEFGHFDETQRSEMVQKRYLAIHKEGRDVVTEKGHMMKARALLVFKNCNWEPVLSTLLFLRVLCLDGIKMLSHLPGQVFDLYLLTYLGLRGTSIKELPDSLEKLHYLETLDVRDTRIEFLPYGVILIPKLRHLLLRSMKIHSPRRSVLIMPSINLHSYQTPSLFKTVSGINLRSHETPPPLQTISGVKVHSFLLSRLTHLSQLKKLSISVTDQEEADVLFASIDQIVNLCSLKIECRDNNGKYTQLMLGTLQPLPLYLEKLTLAAIIMDLPQWFTDFKSLRVLHLVNSMLVSDPLSSFSNLPSLVSLSLFHAYTGEQMGCGPGGFPKLRHLRITSLIELEEWTPIEEGTMPCLKFLSIVECSKLRMLPQGFEQLKYIQSLEVIQMPEEFLTRLRVEDFCKVEHIPNIIGIPSNDLV